MHTPKGFTLLELLITIAVLSIITSIAAPALRNLLLEVKAQTLYREIFTLIQYTRSTAATHTQTTILCPSLDQENCINDWSAPLIIFIDDNNNKQRDTEEEIKRHSQLFAHNAKFVWRAFGSSRYIRFIADGSTEHQSGNFSLCLNNGLHIQQIKLYKTGRARKSRKDEIKKEYCN